jgi:hypothetical protein
MEKITGKKLNVAYKRGAAEARYREDGVWYNTLTKFPADLYDKNGVIRFESDTHYRRLIKIGPHPDHAHADGGICKIRGYERLSPPPIVKLGP